jgi:hypothetical protein
MRLEQVAKLYLQGLEYREIGRRLGCVQSQICYDLKVLKKRWSESALAATNEVRSRELAKLDRLEMEYWDAWQRSCGIKEISTTKRKTNGNGNGSCHDDKASLQGVPVRGSSLPGRRALVPRAAGPHIRVQRSTEDSPYRSVWR